MHKDYNQEQFIKLQKELGLTNEALSRHLGVSLSTIKKRRAGNVKIADEVIMALKFLQGD